MIIENDFKDNWAEIASRTKLKHLQREEVQEKETLVVINVLDHQYALTINEIKEIIAVPHITPIPQTPKYIMGVGNIRGNVFALLDLNKRILKEPFGINKFVVVLKSAELKLGLLINNPPETFVVEKAKINYSSAVLQPLSKEDDFIKGIYKQEERMIFLLDINKIAS
ncbi:MAG: chemotaxis protein CheW [Cyclobacteriaceae bacterium]